MARPPRTATQTLQGSIPPVPCPPLQWSYGHGAVIASTMCMAKLVPPAPRLASALGITTRCACESICMPAWPRVCIVASPNSVQNSNNHRAVRPSFVASAASTPSTLARGQERARRAPATAGCL